MAHFLTDEQFRTLTAICDTLIPAIKRDGDLRQMFQVAYATTTCDADASHSTDLHPRSARLISA
jgi:hypothetical protein